MSRKYQELDRKSGESLEAYDNRINALEPLLIGYSYFSASGYDAEECIYGLYIVWNGEVNDKLKNPHPEYGYCINCDMDSALQLFGGGNGIGVYGKLYSYQGKISVISMSISYADDIYGVIYLGRSVQKPDNVCFLNMKDGDKKLVSEVAAQNDISVGAGSFSVGSFSIEHFSVGSFNLGSFNVGSFSLSGFNTGSFNLGSFNIGSFKLSGFNTGSFNLGSFNISSFNMGSFNIGSFSLGSFSLSSFNAGSFSLGSFNLSSFNLGSFNLGSFNLGNFNVGSIAVANNDSNNESNNKTAQTDGMPITTLSKEEFNMKDFYKDVFGIGYLGYGLNLI